MTDSVFKYINQKLQVERIFYILAKAFDSMNHEILLAELHFCRIRGVSEYYVYCSVHHNIFYEITNRFSYMQSILFHC